ncbi:hypothetical protein IWZ03DRAFT_370525 [Phyllosticta citriasiana]|uniref:Uncharacterized protein n=1 Tax=Phyllosticta citriasiana TaxID=595635 RepID=A0ABR1KVJ0_9PEZI
MSRVRPGGPSAASSITSHISQAGSHGFLPFSEGNERAWRSGISSPQSSMVGSHVFRTGFPHSSLAGSHAFNSVALSSVRARRLLGVPHDSLEGSHVFVVGGVQFSLEGSHVFEVGGVQFSLEGSHVFVVGGVQFSLEGSHVFEVGGVQFSLEGSHVFEVGGVQFSLVGSHVFGVGGVQFSLEGSHAAAASRVRPKNPAPVPHCSLVGSHVFGVDPVHVSLVGSHVFEVEPVHVSLVGSHVFEVEPVHVSLVGSHIFEVDPVVPAGWLVPCFTLTVLSLVRSDIPRLFISLRCTLLVLSSLVRRRSSSSSDLGHLHGRSALSGARTGFGLCFPPLPSSTSGQLKTLAQAASSGNYCGQKMTGAGGKRLYIRDSRSLYRLGRTCTRRREPSRDGKRISTGLWLCLQEFEHLSNRIYSSLNTFC